MHHRTQLSECKRGRLQGGTGQSAGGEALREATRRSRPFSCGLPIFKGREGPTSNPGEPAGCNGTAQAWDAYSVLGTQPAAAEALLLITILPHLALRNESG